MIVYFFQILTNAAQEQITVIEENFVISAILIAFSVRGSQYVQTLQEDLTAVAEQDSQELELDAQVMNKLKAVFFMFH